MKEEIKHMPWIDQEDLDEEFVEQLMEARTSYVYDMLEKGKVMIDSVAISTEEVRSQHQCLGEMFTLFFIVGAGGVSFLCDRHACKQLRIAFSRLWSLAEHDPPSIK